MTEYAISDDFQAIPSAGAAFRAHSGAAPDEAVGPIIVLAAILLAAAGLNLWVDLAFPPVTGFEVASPWVDTPHATLGGSAFAGSAYRMSVPGVNRSQADMLAQQTADFGAYGLAKTVEAAATACGLTRAQRDAGTAPSGAASQVDGRT